LGLNEAEMFQPNSILIYELTTPEFSYMKRGLDAKVN
jgi:hypothetical protein